MRNWIEPLPVEIPGEIAAWLGDSPLLAQALARRGFTTLNAARGFLDPDFYTPSPPDALPDIDKGVARTRSAISNDEMICVWGDFDVDGQTATAVLVSALHALGANVTYYIPHHEREGHGLRVASIKRLIANGTRLIVTCDTGITASEAVDFARTRDVDLIITDHHSLTARLPDAMAVINPKRMAVGHPLYELTGAGVAYKFAEALCGSGEVRALLDLAALGIAADVATLTGDTRYLLQKGLQTLRSTSRPGLLALMHAAGVKPEEANESTIGFVLAPRLNALGRAGAAHEAVQLLTTDNPVLAGELALKAEVINNERRLQAKQVYEAAVRMIESDRSLQEPGALVLSHATWPSGILGIVANRLADELRKPVVLLATPSGHIARGSARSVEGCDITAALAKHRSMLKGFGGHKMAAGLTIAQEQIPAFGVAFSHTVQEMLEREQTAAALMIDAYVSLSELSMQLVEQIEHLAPFGVGNPPLVLASRGLRIKSSAPIGRNDEHLRMTVIDDNGHTGKAIWWQGGDMPVPQGRLDLAYTVRSSVFRDKTEVLIEWIASRAAADGTQDLPFNETACEVVDYRNMQDAFRLLMEVRARESNLLVWREADDRVDGVTRTGLMSVEALAVWSTPPGLKEWQIALDIARPKRVFLFANNTEMDSAQHFLRRLAGLLKTAAYSGEPVLLDQLAAETSQQEVVVRTGLRALAGQGLVDISEMSDNRIIVSVPGSRDPGSMQTAQKELGDLLRETAAFRRYWRTANQLPGL